jgi:hypothetical protein
MFEATHNQRTNLDISQISARRDRPLRPLLRIGYGPLDSRHAPATLPGESRMALQYRICFEWREGEAVDVEIVDYH